MKYPELTKALNDFKSKVIGLYKPINDNDYCLITEYNKDGDEEVITYATLTPLFALHITYGFPVRGKVAMFPDGKNMTDMLNDPFEFNDFLKKLD